MKYYVIEIATGDSKIQGKGIYEYDSKNSAVAAYHKKLGTAMASELYVSDVVLVIDECGGVVIGDYYAAGVNADEVQG